MRPRSHRFFYLTPVAIAATLGWASAGCDDPAAAPIADVPDTTVESDAPVQPTTARFRGAVVTDGLSPRGIGGATVSWFDEPERGKLTTDAFGFFEVDVPTGRPLSWLVTADGFMTTIAILPAWSADSDSYFPLTLRSSTRLAELYVTVATNGAPEPVAGRAHVEARGIYWQFRTWAGGMTVAADTPAVYPPWNAEPPAAPMMRADRALPAAWLPNVDPATEAVTFTMRDRFGNGCGSELLGDAAGPITLPVRADTITTVNGFCRFPAGQRPVEGRVTAPNLDNFVDPFPAVGVQVCVLGEDVCATSDADGEFHMVVADEPHVTLRAETADQIPVLWPLVRPHDGLFNARNLYTDSSRTPEQWREQFTTDGVAATFGAEADVFVNIDVPVGDLVVQVDGSELMPYYLQDNFDPVTRVRRPGGAWFIGIPPSAIQDGYVTVLLTLPVPEECRGTAWFEAFFVGPAMMKVPAAVGHLTMLPPMNCD